MKIPIPASTIPLEQDPARWPHMPQVHVLNAKCEPHWVTLVCYWCGRKARVRLPWEGRPQGPQCACNPHSWGNWVFVPSPVASGSQEGKIQARPDAPGQS